MSRKQITRLISAVQTDVLPEDRLPLRDLGPKVADGSARAGAMPLDWERPTPPDWLPRDARIVPFEANDQLFILDEEDRTRNSMADPR